MSVPRHVAVIVGSALVAATAGADTSLRFYGNRNADLDVDRVKIAVDDPGTPADIGTGDFTIEFWLKGLTADFDDVRRASCRDNDGSGWIQGNIVLDRAQWGDASHGDFGVSVFRNGVIGFGLVKGSAGTGVDLCGDSAVLDGVWHHIALTRGYASGTVRLFVDGRLEDQASGPPGDVSYEDGRNYVVGDDETDPFLIVGAEKYSLPSYPSFSGWIDELRISRVIRYTADFTPDPVAFTPDADTAALYHFDEASGDSITDSAFGAASPGVRRYGGSPPGPVWDTDTPFSSNPGALSFVDGTLALDEDGGAVSLEVTRNAGTAGAVSVDYATGGGSATPGSDYAPVVGSLFWSDGESGTRSLDVPVLDDAANEEDESFVLTLSNPTGGATLADPAVALVTILDDDEVQTSLDALSPETLDAGSGDFTLIASGSGFVQGSVVRWNGAARPTTFVSTGELRAAIAAADVATPGSASVAVYDPATGNVSGALGFDIEDAPPVADSISPASATAGDPGFSLVVDGSGFQPGSVVRWDGAERPTSYVSGNRVQAGIAAADLESPGTVEVSVRNPGGLETASLSFAVEAQPGNPVPATSALAPASAPGGGAGFTLTVSGTGFVAGAAVRWNGSARATTWISSGELRASIAAADIAAPGSATVTVYNPAPGGGSSNPQTFTISEPGGGDNPAPRLTALSPSAATSGDPELLLTVTGSGFSAASVVRWNGTERPTSYVSADSLQVTIPTDDLQTPGVATLTVRSPAPGGGTSAPHYFFVLGAGSRFFYDDFNRADNPVLGNGWIEKTPAAFAVAEDRVASANLGVNNLDSIAYRPNGEDVTDVEVGMDFVRLARDFQFPQVHARVQRDTVAQAQTLDSYMLSINEFASPPIAFIGRQAPQPGYYECVIAQVELSGAAALVAGERYRLRLRVSGADPVYLHGFIEQYDGDHWQDLTSLSAVHDETTTPGANSFCDPGFMPPPLVQTGTTGISKWRDRTDLLDNYYWYELSGDAPVIEALMPDSANAGSEDFTLIVTGRNFTADSVVRWDGSERPTSFVSAQELRADIAAADVAVAGSASVSVFIPAPVHGTSAAIEFPIVETGDSDLFDDFERANAADPGNGWIEKTPRAFSLIDGAMVKRQVSGGITENVVYRPAAEDLADVQAQVEFELDSSLPGYPQVLTRIQSDSVAQPGTLDAYVLFVDDSPTTAVLARSDGTNIRYLRSLDISPALNATGTYRLRLRTTGADPVQVNAWIERRNGSGWDVIGQTGYQDSAADRITGAGSVGFGGYIYSGYRYEAFTRTAQ